MKKWIKNKLRKEIIDEFLLEVFNDRWNRKKPTRVWSDKTGTAYLVKIVFGRG